MSAEAFEKLSLGDQMVTTRAGAARLQSAPSRASSSSTSSTDSSPSPEVIKSVSSGIRYNVGVLDEEARSRAELALGDNSIGMKYCTQTGGQSNQYIFHVYDDITVEIGGPSMTPSCNCGANDDGIACKHIYWIEDQLTAGAPFNKEIVQLADDGSIVHNIPPAKMLDRMTIEKTSAALDWVFHSGGPLDGDDIEDEMQNLLSVFEPTGALPSEFKAIAESPSLTQRSRIYRDLCDALTKYATQDAGLFLTISALITPAFQADVFFDKISERITRTFKALDEYIQHGPSDTLIESCDVVTCAAKLQELVRLTDAKYQEQMEEDPGSKDVAVRAAACLISILDGVTNRNYDAYAGITWGGLAPMEPAQNNLFACLIASCNGSGELFVLDALRGFPQDDVLRNHWEILSRIGEKLEECEAPGRYLGAFRSIVSNDRRKRMGSDVGGGSAKRAMKSMR